MRSIVKHTGKLLIAGLTFCFMASNAFANTLSEIEVYQNGSGYGIDLKTESSAQMKKITPSSDRLIVLLKDVNVAENINTIYNNVSKMDNVTIQHSGKNDLKIVFKGKGISNSRVSFASAGTKSAYPETRSIQLNAPVSSYTPVYNPELIGFEHEPTQTANPKLNEILTQMHISREMLLTAKRYAKSAVRKTKSLFDGNGNSLTIFGALLIAAAFVFKPRRKSSYRIPQKQQKSIGIPSRSNMEREIDINQNLANNMNLKPSIQNTYGVNAYKQSQRNPYMSTNQPASNGISGIARRTPLKRTANPEPKTVTKESAPLKNKTVANSPISSQKPQMHRLSDMKSPASALINKTKPTKTEKNIESEVDSMKFLESITKIYENSGRTDLAKGLKDNLRKAQLTKV